MRFSIIFVLLLSLAMVSGEETEKFNPEKVLLGRFTFVRPTNWQWVDTRSDITNVVQSVTFEVNYPGNNNACRAYFNQFLPEKPAGHRKAVAKRWKDSFVDVKGPVAFGKPRTIGTNQISYLQLNGTFKPDPKSTIGRKDFCLYGAIIESPEGNIIMRLMGPAVWVKKATADFRKMNEDALREE